MGFSFRSLYADDDHPGQGATVSPPSIDPASESLSQSRSMKSGIPGPLTRKNPAQVSFSSLDVLQPESVFSEKLATTPQDEPPCVSVPEVSAQSIPASTGGGLRNAQITLRAVFASTDAFTIDSIAALTAKLPGIISCIIKAPDGAVLATAEPKTVRSLETTVDFPQLESLQPGCDLFGLGQVNGVMLHSETDRVSCFSCAGIILMARHSGEDLEPGLWEKLILITEATAEVH